jgi:hypothetical protein
MLVFYGMSQVTAQQVDCESMSMPTCQDGNRINISNNGKIVAPPNLCVDPGETITVSVSPDGTSARVEGKNGGWPNDSGSEFTLIAPESGTYDYNVYFSDGSCLDPRIKVKD